MFEKSFQEIAEVLNKLIFEEWLEIHMFFSHIKNSTSYVIHYKTKNGFVRFPSNGKGSITSYQDEKHLSYVLKNFSDNFLKETGERFIGFEFKLRNDKNLYFDTKFYYEGFETLDVNSATTLWEYIKFNDSEDQVDIILKIEQIKLEDLPFVKD